jgi:hypothetical protein
VGQPFKFRFNVAEAKSGATLRLDDLEVPLFVAPVIQL